MPKFSHFRKTTDLKSQLRFLHLPTDFSHDYRNDRNLLKFYLLFCFEFHLFTPVAMQSIHKFSSVKYFLFAFVISFCDLLLQHNEHIKMLHETSLNKIATKNIILVRVFHILAQKHKLYCSYLQN